jgi:prepilin-type N-terminal cleavage/methylation domain-containing protein
MRTKTRARDAGFGLIELLISITLLGIGMVGILGAYGTLVQSGDLSKKYAEVAPTLNAVAESLGDPGRNQYLNCVTPASNPTYNPIAGVTLPSGYSTAQITWSVAYWNGTIFQPSSVANSCYDTTIGSFARLQQLTVSVQSPDGRVQQTVTIVKRGL